MKKHLLRFITWLSVLLLAFGFIGDTIPALSHAQAESGFTLLAAWKKTKATATPRKKATPSPAPTATPEPSGPIIEPQDIADYLFLFGELPGNFITKREAQELGWDSRYNYVSDVAPGYSIGGDRFGNYEGLLPKAKGRQYYEADCYYTTGKRNAHRIVFSNDGLVYYTSDHYETFVIMLPSRQDEK